MHNRVEILTLWTELLGPKQNSCAIAYLASEIFGDVPEQMLNAAVVYSIKNDRGAVPAELRQIIDSGMFGDLKQPEEKVVVVKTWRDVVDQEINDMAFSSRSEMIEHLQMEKSAGGLGFTLVDPQTNKAFDVLQRLMEDVES